jgi:hypothetical protein
LKIKNLNTTLREHRAGGHERFACFAKYTKGKKMPSIRDIALVLLQEVYDFNLAILHPSMVIFKTLFNGLYAHKRRRLHGINKSLTSA